MTRRSGFSASSAVEMQFDEVNGYYLKDGQELLYEFSFPQGDHKVRCYGL